MAQMGHTTPNLTLAIYARQMDRRDGEPKRLKTLVSGRENHKVEPIHAQSALHSVGLHSVGIAPVA
jgi:hypothetical protein